MAINTDGLPPPSVMEVEDLTAMDQSQWQSGSLLFGREPDPEVRPRMFTLVYSNVHGAVADAARQHFKAYAFTDFEWTPLGTTQPVRVTYLSGPPVSWATVARASFRVVLLEELAHD